MFHNGGGGLLGGGTSLNIDLIPHFTVPRVVLIVLTMTAGTVVVMWLGELITQRGVGQGMSVLIFTNVVATMPSGGASVKAEAGLSKFTIIVILSLVLLVAIVFIEQGQRRIPVTFAKRVVGRRMYGGQSTYIPMKVNTGGVVPIIFASSVLYFPILISNVLPSHGAWEGVQHWISVHLAQPNDLWYIFIYGLLILGFAYFYAAITFDPHQQAEVIRKQGGYIPGIRPGPPTERHLQNILNRDHSARCPVAGADRPPAVDLPGLLEHPELSLCGHQSAHRRRRLPGDHEAGRQPADAPQLRGLPQVVPISLDMIGRRKERSR